jgi:hypothetical protein
MALAPTTPADQSICTPICVGRSRGSTRSTRTAAQNSAGSWTPSIGTKPTAPTHSPTSNHTLRHRDYCSHLLPAMTRKLHATPRHLSRCRTQRWLLRRTGETLQAPGETSSKPQRGQTLRKDEPFNPQRSITSDGDQTDPGVRKARAVGPSPAAVHALPSRALWPGCARAHRRARDRVACPWARRRTRSHRPLPHSLASSGCRGGVSAKGLHTSFRSCRDGRLRRGPSPTPQHRVPGLFYLGTKDRACSPEEIALAAEGRTELQAIPGADHVATFTRSADVLLSAVLPFINRR